MSGSCPRAGWRARLLAVLAVGAVLLTGVVTGAGTSRAGSDSLRVLRTATAAPGGAPAASSQDRHGSDDADRLGAVPASLRVEHQAPASASVVRTARTTSVPGSTSAGLLPDRRGPPVAAFVVVRRDRDPHAAATLRSSPRAARAPPLPA